MYYLPLEDGSGRPGTGIDRRWCLELKTDEGEYYHFEKEVEVQHTAGIGISTVKISNTSVDAGDHITLSGKIVDSDLLGEYDTERPIQMTDIELVASN